MTPEEKEAMRDNVELAVQKGNEPIWTKLRDHDTQLALHKQDMRNSQVSQIAQGERLGSVEKKVDKMSTTARVVWLIVTVVAGLVAWLISTA